MGTGKWQWDKGVVDTTPLLVNSDMHACAHATSRLAQGAAVCEEVGVVVLLAGQAPCHAPKLKE